MAQPHRNQPPPVEEWALIGMPPMPPGVEPPTIPSEFRAGLTKPDGDGHQWAILSIVNAAATFNVRIPPMLAAMVGQGIAHALTEVQGQWEAGGGGKQVSRLLLPNGGQANLLVPGQGGGPGRV